VSRGSSIDHVNNKVGVEQFASAATDAPLAIPPPLSHGCCRGFHDDNGGIVAAGIVQGRFVQLRCLVVSAGLVMIGSCLAALYSIFCRQGRRWR
jgi:hypothetical protein